MADITDPRAIKFCNENARTIADLIEKFHRTIPTFMLNVVQDFEKHTANNADQDKIVDLNQPNDPRNPLVKVNVAELKYVVEQLQLALETDDRLEVGHRFVVNGQPIY